MDEVRPPADTREREKSVAGREGFRRLARINRHDRVPASLKCLDGRPHSQRRLRCKSLTLIRVRDPLVQEPSDEQLVERVVERDRVAFSQLVDRHLRRAVSLAHSVLRISAEADDVAQEVFVRLWERPTLFDARKARFTTWLHRVVVNLCIDRKRGQRFEPIECLLERAAADACAVDAINTEQHARAVNEALAALPVRQRTALALFYMHDLPQREAASAMTLSDSAFESLLHRARAALSRALGYRRHDPENRHDQK